MEESDIEDYDDDRLKIVEEHDGTSHMMTAMDATVLSQFRAVSNNAKVISDFIADEQHGGHSSTSGSTKIRKNQSTENKHCDDNAGCSNAADVLKEYFSFDDDQVKNTVVEKSDIDLLGEHKGCGNNEEQNEEEKANIQISSDKRLQNEDSVNVIHNEMISYARKTQSKIKAVVVGDNCERQQQASKENDSEIVCIGLAEKSKDIQDRGAETFEIRQSRIPPLRKSEMSEISELKAQLEDVYKQLHELQNQRKTEKKKVDAADECEKYKLAKDHNQSGEPATNASTEGSDSCPSNSKSDADIRVPVPRKDGSHYLMYTSAVDPRPTRSEGPLENDLSPTVSAAAVTLSNTVKDSTGLVQKQLSAQGFSGLSGQSDTQSSTMKSISSPIPIKRKKMSRKTKSRDEDVGSYPFSQNNATSATHSPSSIQDRCVRNQEDGATDALLGVRNTAIPTPGLLQDPSFFNHISPFIDRNIAYQRSLRAPENIRCPTKPVSFPELQSQSGLPFLQGMQSPNVDQLHTRLMDANNIVAQQTAFRASWLEAQRQRAQVERESILSNMALNEAAARAKLVATLNQNQLVATLNQNQLVATLNQSQPQNAISSCHLTPQQFANLETARQQQYFAQQHKANLQRVFKGAVNQQNDQGLLNRTSASVVTADGLLPFSLNLQRFSPLLDQNQRLHLRPALPGQSLQKQQQEYNPQDGSAARMSSVITSCEGQQLQAHQLFSSRQTVPQPMIGQPGVHLVQPKPSEMQFMSSKISSV
ncbi:hypothetical protein AB6A40_004908 [Gnathostoma spinigerum]|uniref:Uncharacterized protein n=1 Tax=Gnathostoma spinigerum TaxID=75299 RepID=A0ABD6ELL2_9BILA